jgi:prophage regulatory protein
MSDPVFLRRKQVARLLNVTVPTLWRWTKKGIFPKPIKLGPNVSGWAAADVYSFLESRRNVDGEK